MLELLMLADRTLLLIGARLLFALLLVAVQLYVLRAILRIIRSMQFSHTKERILTSSAFVFLVIVNLPLAFFIVESVIRPHELMLYAPPSAFELTVSPFSYVFFIWTIGSLFFAAASPILMACFAAVQFFRHKTTGPVEAGATIEVFDLSRRRFLQVALTAASAMPFAISAYGAVAARTRKVVERVFVPIGSLPPQLDGFTIVQLSDIHSGMFMREAQMTEYARIASSLKPDIIGRLCRNSQRSG